MSVIVLLPEYPQCRGEGPTLLDALRAARQEFNHLCECRVSWRVEEALTDEHPRGCLEPHGRSSPLDRRMSGGT
jgi:hypothetical protein